MEEEISETGFDMSSGFSFMSNEQTIVEETKDTNDTTNGSSSGFSFLKQDPNPMDNDPIIDNDVGNSSFSFMSQSDDLVPVEDESLLFEVSAAARGDLSVAPDFLSMENISSTPLAHAGADSFTPEIVEIKLGKVAATKNVTINFIFAYYYYYFNVNVYYAYYHHIPSGKEEAPGDKNWIRPRRR